ncbi:MAG: acyl-CoA thioesterase [Candidatus Marinimicrobia bacterium]|nr:acyl-CoA thioesterase [Candidatus Neomarinimicrobiota bacterium]
MDLKAIRRKDFDYLTAIEARWRDMDGLRHINHATYLTYFETGRIQYWSHLGWDINQWEAEVSTILASMKIDYIQQSAHPNTYEIGNRITRLGIKSFDAFSAIFEKGNEVPIVTGNFTIVTFDYQSQETIPVPDIIKKAYNPF